MAPKPKGFNLWGYLLPGPLWPRRGSRWRFGSSAGGEAVQRAPEVPAGAVSATPEELDRLRQALAEVED